MTLTCTVDRRLVQSVDRLRVLEVGRHSSACRSVTSGAAVPGHTHTAPFTTNWRLLVYYRLAADHSDRDTALPLPLRPANDAPPPPLYSSPAPSLHFHVPPFAFLQYRPREAPMTSFQGPNRVKMEACGAAGGCRRVAIFGKRAADANSGLVTWISDCAQQQQQQQQRRSLVQLYGKPTALNCTADI